jgi:hypothetical protein
VTLPARRQPGDPHHGLEGRARVALGIGRRQFVHIWTTPRSTAARAVIVPILLLATLLILAAGLLALIALVAGALVVALFVLIIRAPLAAIRGRSSLQGRRPPQA